jgi:arylsulfatase A-like enzyme
MKNMNLVVICADTFRADIIGKNKKLSFVKTPYLDTLAQESVVFDKCFGEGEPTIPVRRCLFTGIRSFPWRFETPNEGLQPAGMGWHPIPHKHTTLAERLHDMGYCTGLVADTYHMFKPTMNFTRGFLSWRFVRGQENDAYRSGPISEIDLTPYVPEGEADIAKHPTIAQFLLNVKDRQNEEDYLTAQVFQTASNWLEDNRHNTPFFLWVDSFSPHEMWDVPRYYADHYFSDPMVKDYIYPQVLNGRNPSEAVIERTKALYFGFVTYVDRWVGHLLKTIDLLGLQEDTIVVFITDHGTEVWDKGRFSKSADRLYPYNTQLNWFIRNPDGPHGKHSSIWVQNHDFVPTILGVLDIEHEPLDGSNVWSKAIKKTAQHNCDYVITGWGLNVCVRDQDHSVHLCTTGNDRKIRVYDLKLDSEETTNISGQNSEIIQKAISRVEKLTGPLPTTFGQYRQKSSARSMRTYALQHMNLT